MTSEITMRSDIHVITSKLKRTQAAVIKDWDVGDEVQLSYTAEYVGTASGGGSYSIDILVFNITKDSWVYKTPNQISVIYRAFELTVKE